MIEVRAIGVTKPVVDFIPDSEGIVSYTARVSNEGNQLNFETADKLLAYCAREGHWSVFAMCNLVLEIKAPRDISRQILRHSSADFQEFCIAGDSKVHTLLESGAMKKVAIADLYKRYKSEHYWKMSSKLVRVYDEESGKFVPAKIKEVFNTGVRPIYKLTLDNGKTIKSTAEHKFLTKDGFSRLSEISVGDFVGCNGDLCYRNFEWMEKTKREAISCGGGVPYIAEKAGISYHTVRKWLKKLGLSFTKKEVANYTAAWNKGLPKELQPMYGKFHTEETRAKQRESSRSGSESEFYVHGEGKTWRKAVALWSRGYKTELFHKQGGVCGITGVALDIDDCEVDHILPVFKYPELAFDSENLQVVSKKAHIAKTLRERAESRTVPSYSPVKSIEYLGEQETYDLEVEHTSHNYVADGIVTHNSQRYAEVTDEMFTIREARRQDDKNRQNSIDNLPVEIRNEWEKRQNMVISLAKEQYKWALGHKLAKECARVVLPEGNTMSRMYMNGTVRTWLHYIGLRSGNGTQKEHCEVAKACRAEFEKYFPSLTETLDAI